MDGVEVVHAPDKGDDTIAPIVEAHREVIVVTADRVLAERVRAATPRSSGHTRRSVSGPQFAVQRP